MKKDKTNDGSDKRKMSKLEKENAKIDIKSIMERRTVKEVKQWKNEHLKANPMSKRRNLLVA